MDWRTTSRPYRILAHAVELKRRGALETEEGKAWMTLANQTEQSLVNAPDLSDYGRFRVRGYRKAMGA